MPEKEKEISRIHFLEKCVDEIIKEGLEYKDIRLAVDKCNIEWQERKKEDTKEQL